MPAAFVTFLEELGALQLVIPAPPATSGCSEASAPVPPASSGTPGGAAATSGFSTYLTVASDAFDDSGPAIPSTFHKGKGKRSAKLSAKPQSVPPPPRRSSGLLSSNGSSSFLTKLARMHPSTTREEFGAAIVVNPALRQSHITAPWVEEFADARAQAAADSSAAADSPSDTSSARTPVPAADQADVRAELGANAPAQARHDVLADLASTAEI
ncbi:unnamed protein product [Phytophthora fragariaefolia]|uniref:Unnamed protein product n=1 Tax=Phytophthora fragariaefolia TaxID=1490495 RepID=A0A9W6XSS6_9STRA|nr:unnamed protein product [Phytophthora fragariaefolia]